MGWQRWPAGPGPRPSSPHNCCPTSSVGVRTITHLRPHDAMRVALAQPRERGASFFCTKNRPEMRLERQVEFSTMSHRNTGLLVKKPTVNQNSISGGDSTYDEKLDT